MRDYITLGSTPAGEDCAQVGSDNYHPRARKECRLYIEQLKRQLDPKLHLGTKSFPHDFGSYLEVVLYFDPDKEDEVEEMCRIENNLPYEWDEQSKMELHSKV